MTNQNTNVTTIAPVPCANNGIPKKMTIADFRTKARECYIALSDSVDKDPAPAIAQMKPFFAECGIDLTPALYSTMLACFVKKDTVDHKKVKKVAPRYTFWSALMNNGEGLKALVALEVKDGRGKEIKVPEPKAGSTKAQLAEEKAKSARYEELLKQHNIPF